MLLNETKSIETKNETAGKLARSAAMVLGAVALAASLILVSHLAKTDDDASAKAAAALQAHHSDALVISEAISRDFRYASSLNGPTEERTRDPNDAGLVKTAAGEKLSKAEEIDLRISGRYGNPVVGRFLRNVSTQNAIQLYVEATRLIDTRHLEPASYQKRVERSLKNLMQAVENRAFRDANGLSASPQQVAAFRSSLQRLTFSRPVRNSSDALNVMYQTMNVASRQLGLRPTTVAMEFVYGATESLDKYSGFVPKEVNRQPSADLEDHIVGIGVEIKPHDSGERIMRARRGGPAVDAGLRKGDILVSVNGRTLEGQNLDYIADLITGPAGSRMIVGIIRDGQRLSPVTLVRRRVTIHSVSEIRMVDEATGVGYIKLDKFAKSSSAEFDSALWQLHRQGMKSLVIDLRGNPGGLLTTAIDLSNKFLPCGAIVSTRGRTAADQSAERASYEKTWKVPLVVLVDGNSASASEIFAAAIQENRRGVIVGRQSYGKGSVQTHFPLQTVAANLRLTTARFYSPIGRKMAGAGVKPDVKVAKSASSVDRDIKAAISVTRNDRLKTMAMAKSGCRSRANHVLHQGT